MLAPRKTLWSTPDSVLDTLVKWIKLQPNDVVCDIGCGDGRVLIEWASHQCVNKHVTFIGLEICPERAQQAQANVRKAYTSGRIASDVTITIHCANAVDSVHLYSHATVFFLYLIPRGLRLMQPIINQAVRARRSEPLTIVTYMSPLLPHERPIAQAQCTVPHQPGAEWPLYLYHLVYTENER